MDESTQLPSPYDAAKAAADFLKTRAEAPRICAVLGSGLGAFADTLEDAVRIPYAEIPHFHGVKVAGHAGVLVVGRVGADGPRVAVLSGRVHYSEGHSTRDVVHAVRTMRLWGCQGLLITNAAGGIDPSFATGGLMRITDHINLTGANPLFGLNDDRLGPRFPDMSHAYDPALGKLFDDLAQELGIELRTGVYIGVAGPSYETPAEIRMFARGGADAVGMSTVMEVIAARHAGLRVVGVSCITNPAAGLSAELLDHADVKAAAKTARSTFLRLVSAGLIAMDTTLQEGSAE
jgi:purine-nucleoside phosphorylase